MVAPKISQHVLPGQFINILPNDSWGKVMRRPMSVASQGNNLISIIYKVFGEGTKLISEWKENDTIDDKPMKMPTNDHKMTTKSIKRK